MKNQKMLKLLRELVTGKMKIALLGPIHKSFVAEFLPNYDEKKLPNGYNGAPFLGALISDYLNRGLEVIAITTNDNSKKTLEFSHANFKWIVVPSRKHAFRMNGSKLGRMVDFFKHEHNELTNQINKYQPDILHAHWSYEFAHAAKNSNYPFLTTIHDNPYIVLKYFKNLYRLLRLIHSEYVLRNIKYLSTVSPYMLSYASSKSENCKVIPNPTQIKYDQNQITDLINKRINRFDKIKIAMITNGWSGLKNGITGLLAFKLLSKILPNIELHLFGTDTEYNGLAYNDTRTENISNVFFHGIVKHDELITELESIHLLMHTSFEESFGVVLIEAMALGIPTIGGKNSGAVPWVINNTELLADAEKPESFFECMKLCLNDKTKYNEIAQQCYHNVCDRFALEKVTEEYLKYYQLIIKNHNRNS